ncbi:hypothetical protein [Pseudooceanicola nitratireducens]|uniref:hypothetical protein n=1 Tax=Pseudooceanicola nitratireducens TaxID=517719 RepID=UPI003C7D3563
MWFRKHKADDVQEKTEAARKEAANETKKRREELDELLTNLHRERVDGVFKELLPRTSK